MTTLDLTWNGLGLFTGVPQAENFSRIPELLAVRRMAPARTPRTWELGPKMTLPSRYIVEGTVRATEDYLVDAEVAALLVLHGGVITYERYALTGGIEVPWISMSVAKSIVSCLVGIAIAEGCIGGVDDHISDYVSVEAGSAYDGVSIRSVLQMSSGARWNEDYSDPRADPFRMADSTSGDYGGHDGIVATMPRELPPDTICRYNSCDTQALTALVRAATGTNLADYMQTRLSEPLGLTAPGYWILDPWGVEAGYCGLNLTARDYAAIGELYRNLGRRDDRQIVPADWVGDSTAVRAPYLQPGRVITAGRTSASGYGYQWWLPSGDRGDFSAIGVYNQYIYVDPRTASTIVMLAATRRYGTTSDPRVNKSEDAIPLFRAIADSQGAIV